MGTPYHRQARETPTYAWWRLPVAGLLIALIYLVLSMVLVGLGAAWFAVSDSSGSFDGWLESVGEFDIGQLDYFVLDLLGLALLIPSVLLGVLVTGPRPVGHLSSVAGRLRWGWLARTAVAATAITLLTVGGAVAVTALTEPSDVSAPSGIDTRLAVGLLVIILVVPLQSAAEEYLFRGYLMQLVGSWTRFAAVPVVVVTPLFVAGHGYGLWGLLDVGLFGLTAAVLTIRTGGLEAAIAAHAANNVLLFVLDALGVISATDDTGAGPVDLVPTVLASVLLIVVVESMARRHGVRRTRDPIPDPPPPLAPMWPPPPYAMVWHQPPPVVRGPPLHPNTPEYPGELPPHWR